MKKYFIIGSILFFVTCIQLNGQNRAIKIDYTKESGQFNTMFKECIGAGRANEGLRADWQKQLAIPIFTENIKINKTQSFKKEIAINENDVFLVDFEKQ